MLNDLPQNAIFKVLKPLYGIPEAGTHWFNTYHKHHLEMLAMRTSTFDPCLLVTKDQDGPFGLVGMQTDDTLILGDQAFVELEDSELKKANLLAKPAEQLTEQTPLLFNGYKLSLEGDDIFLAQKGQGSRLSTIDPSSPTYSQAYREQRARGAYIGTICQPKAAFDLLVVA